MVELILGGARSGKSALAERRAAASGLEVVYIATATAGDDEMRARIEQHQQDRPQDWSVIEEPVALAAVLQREAGAGRCLLVDCLTLWLSNCLFAQPSCWAAEYQRLCDLLPTLPGRVILVSNETGLGVVPMGQMSREFVDESGRLHQKIAALAGRVTLTVAGLPMTLKGVVDE